MPMTKVTNGKDVFERPCEFPIYDKLKHALDIAKFRVKEKNFDYLAICLAEGTLIKTIDGDISIENLLKEKKKVLSYDFKNRKIIETIPKCFFSGKNKVFEIKTEDGRKVQATEEHIFFIKDGKNIIEVKLKDLKKGDMLICMK